MCQEKRFTRSQGFTLIELLVAMTLMALVSVILFGGLRFGMRAWETGGRHLEDSSGIQTVQSLLRRQVGQARFLPQPANAGPVAPFVGESHSLVFISPLPVKGMASGSYLFRLAQHEREGGSDLTLAWRVYRPELLAGDLQAFDEETVLLSNITTINLSYYGALDPEMPLQWWDSWNGSDGRPRLVRLHVEFPSGDTRRWPDLIIRVVGSAR